MDGSALIIVVLLGAIMGLIGIACLVMGEAERSIAVHHRNTLAALYAAEAGARLAVAWFNDPGPEGFLAPGPDDVDRSRRMLDHDGDPATPRLPARAGDPVRPLYKDGVIAASGLFDRPYEGSLVDPFLGAESDPGAGPGDEGPGPDVVVGSRHLETINAALFPDLAGAGPIVGLVRMELYAPPSPAAGFAPVGIATIKVVAGLFPGIARAGTSPLATRTVRAVIARIPVGAPDGALHACGGLTAVGRLDVRWGAARAAGDARLPEDLDAGVPSGLPYALDDPDRYIHGESDLAAWAARHDGERIDDPWFRLLTGGAILGAPGTGLQPWPHRVAGDPGSDHSNLFQHVPYGCPGLDYGLFRKISLGGSRYTHYFSHVAGDLFSLDGSGPPESVRVATAGRSGVMFFDTADGRPPGEPVAGAPGANLTPGVEIRGGRWGTRGVLFLNARSLLVDGPQGVERTLTPPGEPQDESGFVNLQHPSSADSVPVIRTRGASFASFIDPDTDRWSCTDAARCDDEVRLPAPAPRRDLEGLPFRTPVAVDGLLYVAGSFTARGEVGFFGSVLAGGEVRVEGEGARFHFDAALGSGGWPRGGPGVPRVYVAAWHTNR